MKRKQSVVEVKSVGSLVSIECQGKKMSGRFNLTSTDLARLVEAVASQYPNKHAAAFAMMDKVLRSDIQMITALAPICGSGRIRLEP